MTELKDTLKLIYKKRYCVNSRYSQNAFARDLGLSPTALSQFLSNKRSLAPKNVARIVCALGLPPDTCGRFKKSASEETLGRKLEIETFSLIAEWHHFGILNLVEVDRIKSPEDISSRLDIPVKAAEVALERLVGLGFVKRTRGVYRRIQATLDAGTNIPSIALRKHNREKMELAIASLESVPLDKRDISSLTLTFDPKVMCELQAEILRFKKKIQKISKKGVASEVYSLNIQFFPLSKKGFKK